MTDEAALDLGAELVANTVTIVIGLVAIALQQSLSASSDSKKNAEQQAKDQRHLERVQQLENRLFDVGFQVEHLDTKIRELNRTILSMKSYNSVSKAVLKQEEEEEEEEEEEADEWES